MKFTGKLFLWIMILVTAAFIAFGMWMLDSSFNRMLEQERQQASQEIQMFQYFLEVGYRSGEQYGEIYALQKAIDSMTINVDRTGSDCIVLDGDGVCYSGQQELEQLKLIVDVDRMMEIRGEASENSYIWQICMGNDGHELASMCISMLGNTPYYLLISRNIQKIYDTRADTIRQYQIMLFVLLAVAAVCAWVLARYLTRPIRRLGWVTKRIAAGDLTRRSDYHQPDEVGELAESFNLMADRLVEQMREKELEAKRQEDFTAAFAHELKTPLTSIIGYADMLRSRRLDEEKSFLSANYIYTEGKRLEAMSLRLLDIIVTKRQEVEFQTVSTGFLFDYLEEVFAGREDIEFVFSCEKAKVRMEANLIKTVLINLVDNACKASEEKGRVEVTGKTEEKGYRFSVRDYGTGIPKEEISKITKAFYMVDKSRARSKNGAGLGLALCAEILALHGSRLKIESEPGKGSTFSFVLFVCREESA